MTVSSNPGFVFSIVIPAYNYAKTLPRALSSALEQGGDDVEILVVNDGSTDNTEDVLQDLYRKHTGRFRYINRNNHGAAATRNYGIANTSAEWLIFLDCDDSLMPGALNVFREMMDENPSAKCIVGGHIAVEPDGSERYRGINAENCSRMTSEQLFKEYLINKSVTPSNGATLVHRSLFERISFPEELRNSEDIPVFAAMLACLPCVFVDKPINKVYKHHDSLRHNTVYADQVGDKLVNKVFDLTVIPKEYAKYRKKFAAQRYLSLFRTFYLANDRNKAMEYYRAAIRESWVSVFKLSYTKKAIRCILT